MKTENSIEANAKLILDMYEYALEYKMDIANEKDVRTILEKLGQTDTNTRRVQLLMTGLAVMDHRIRNDMRNRKKTAN